MLASKNHTIYQKITSKKGQIAILIDPEKTNEEKQIQALVQKAEFAKIDYFFVGGSTVSHRDFEKVIASLKSFTTIPIVIFPGDYSQFSKNADAILYLSLLSGRNPEYLIGQHVKNALEIYRSKIETIPTAYILIDGGTKSSVAYVSQTTPIPQDSYSIAVNTVIAGILQGKSMIFLDAGSGAINAVNLTLIQHLRAETDLPIIVGGGIRKISQIEAYKKQGVNVVVIGNKIEEEIDFLLAIEEFQRH